VEHGASGALACPECGAAAKRYGTRLRRWRHLPTCQYKTILATEVPRGRCPQHGVKTLAVPWSDCPVRGDWGGRDVVPEAA